MVCDFDKTKLDAYLDGELSAEQMRIYDAHVKNCPSCSAEALDRVQLKRAVQVAGKRFMPSTDFRQRIQRKSQPARPFYWTWLPAAFAAAVLLVVVFALLHLASRSSRNHIYGEIADLHVESLASANPVDVVSTDRHTVKPWFQGKIPFSFNLPELQNSDFTLIGGRVTYLDQTPGAHLIYDLRKHHISVFIFPQRPFESSLTAHSTPKKQSFNIETWSQNGLRYFVIGDASHEDIDNLANLLKAAS